MENKIKGHTKLKIIVTIIDRTKVDFYTNLLKGYNVNFQTIIYGKGTAPTEIMQYLGLINDTKAVIIGITTEDRCKEILNAYEDKHFKVKKNKGVAFTISLSSLIGVSFYKFLCNDYNIEM